MEMSDSKFGTEAGWWPRQGVVVVVVVNRDLRVIGKFEL